MSLLTLVAIALLTYGSRALSLIVLPRPSARLEAVLARIPAPIFAGLAMATLLTDDRRLVDGPIVWAAAGSLLASPSRSLLPCLAGGAAGYTLGVLAARFAGS
jgi:branched-subunit amino acid transport protein